MTRPDSISRRLTLALTGLVAVLWLLAAAVSTAVIRHELNEAFDSALQETAQRLLPLAVADLFAQETLEPPLTAAATGIAEHREYLTYQVRDGSGRVLLRSHDAREAAFAVPLARGFSNTAGFRVYTEPTISDTVFIQVAEPLAHRREALVESAAMLLLPVLLLVPLSALAIAAIVRRGLRPVAALRDAIERRGGDNLAPLDRQPLPDELAPIAAAVDHLLARLRAAVEAERSFAANSAHELRTPIAAALAQTQRLAAALADGPNAERVDRIEATLRRLQRLVSKLLQLARADAGIGAGGGRVDLLPALRAVVDEYARDQRGRGRLRLDDGGHARLEAAVDIDGFGIVMANLVENALVHGTPGAPVTVRIDADGAVHVVNAGPVVPAATLATLTHRFARGTGTGEGAGLGLAIAEAILRQSGGRLVIRSPAGGQSDGFEAVVILEYEKDGGRGWD